MRNTQHLLCNFSVLLPSEIESIVRAMAETGQYNIADGGGSPAKTEARPGEWSRFCFSISVIAITLGLNYPTLPAWSLSMASPYFCLAEFEGVNCPGEL